MHITSNLISHGGAFEDQLFGALTKKKASAFFAVSGYVGRETVTRLTRLVETKPTLSVRLVVGMAAKEGIAKGTYQALETLSETLKANSPISGDKDSDVYWYFSGKGGIRDRGLHAKAYRVTGESVDDFFIGSSNFSNSGLSLRGNIEINAIQLSSQAKLEFDTFFQDHLANGYSFVPFDSVKNFPIRGVAKSKRKTGGSLVKVQAPKNFKSFPYVDLDLSRNIERQTQSNLNVCFGKGRWARATGIVSPRDWYEVELISPKSITSDSNYPRGDFLATTSDGFQFDARTQGDYLKNLRSKGDLHTMGLWLKGLLEDAGALSADPQELVSADTFSTYGNSILRMYKKSRGEYVLHFPRDAADL